MKVAGCWDQGIRWRKDWIKSDLSAVSSHSQRRAHRHFAHKRRSFQTWVSLWHQGCIHHFNSQSVMSSDLLTTGLMEMVVSNPAHQWEPFQNFSRTHCTVVPGQTAWWLTSKTRLMQAEPWVIPFLEAQSVLPGMGMLHFHPEQSHIVQPNITGEGKTALTSTQILLQS